MYLTEMQERIETDPDLKNDKMFMRDMKRNVYNERFGQGPDVEIPQEEVRSYRHDSLQKNKWFKNLQDAMKEGTKELKAEIDG